MPNDYLDPTEKTAYGSQQTPIEIPPEDLGQFSVMKEQEEAEAKKSACIILFIIFAVLALAGAGIWYYLSRNAEAPKDANKTEEQAEKDPNLIAAATGGKITKDKFEIIIPPGALAKDTKIYIEKVAYGDVTDLYHVKPDGLQFLKPVTLAVPYKESGLFFGQTPYDIDLGYWFKGEEADRNLLRYSVDREEKKLRTQVSRF